MNDKYLELAVTKIKDPNLLVILASKRAKELARGAHPMVPVDRYEGVNYLDVALQEVAEGKIDFEIPEE